MRGKVAYTDLQRPSPGITPAYAGKSLLKLLHHVGLRDHPRVCGEKAYSLVINGSESGPPPRMRGKGESDPHGLSKPGITPRYAGKSPGSRRCHLELRGSPPRMRGKVPCRSAAGRAGGITPAYAGKRTKQNTNSQGGKDHPRVCGEKAAIAGLLPSLLGSPPRMRGKELLAIAYN